jgi:hypothetical protein
MKRTKISVLITLFVLVFMVIGITQGWLAAGSYPYAQEYRFDVRAIDLVKKIEQFKKVSHNFISLSAVNDQLDSYGNHHIYLYDSVKDEVIHLFVEVDDKNLYKSNLFLEGYNKGRVLGNWKVINKEFDRRENLDKKRRFRDSVLDKLGLFYKDRGNSMFVFWK